MRTKKSLYSFLALIVGAVVLVNVLSSEFFFRLDFTADQRYTLSQATRNILNELEEPVTVTAYFSEDLPPQMLQARTDFMDLLMEYASLSDGNVVYEFINPNESEDLQREAQTAGIQAVQINVRDKDQMKMQRAYIGAIVQLGEQKEVIPFIQPGASMEYDLSSSIKKLAVTDKPVIGLVQGHGEPSIRELSQASQMLNILYDVEEVDLSDTALVLNDYKTLVVIRPTDSIPQQHLQKLDGFLAKGKNLFVAINRVDANLQQNLQGNPLTTGLETWLSDKGLLVENNFVIDQSCANVTVQQPGFPFPIQVPFYYLPIVSTFADHPATAGLEAIILQFASSITYTGDTGNVFTPLAFSSARSGTQPAPTYFDIQRNWTEADFPLGNLPIAAALEGALVGKAASKIVVVGDGDFVVNGTGQQGQQQQLQPDNVSLMVNAIDWLSDDTGLIGLRTKGITARPIDPDIEDGHKQFLKYLNFLLPLLLIIVYGVIRSQTNRNTRIKRMEEGYV